MFGLKMELMVCAGLVGGTTEKSFLFPELIWYYKWYEIILRCLHYTSAVPQPFWLSIAANLAQAGCLGWKWSLWTVPTWLAVQRSKAVFFLTLYDSINYIIYLLYVWSIPSRATDIFVVGYCQIGPSWMFGLKMELMACADLVGGTMEQSCIFTDLIW